jgi:hypothetical protein
VYCDICATLKDGLLDLFHKDPLTSNVTQRLTLSKVSFTVNLNGLIWDAKQLSYVPRLP